MNQNKAGKDKPFTFHEFASLLEAQAKADNLDFFDQLDYFLAHEKEEKIVSDDIEFRSDTHFGGSEGIYTTFEIMSDGQRKHAFTAKTLKESDEDYIRMHVLAAKICLMAKRYIREHGDEFNWTGFDVSYVKDGKTVPYMWCGKIENARKYASDMKTKGYETVIRDNATRQIFEK